MNLTDIYKPSPATHLVDGIYQTNLTDVLFIEANKHTDERGFFAELVRLPELNQVIAEPFHIEQLNLARSVTHVARGFHRENWAKLIMVLTGECLSVIVDIRPESPTFGQHLKLHFGDSGQTPAGAIYLPRGMGNGYLALSGPVNYFYCFNALYKNRDTSGDMSLSLFDPDVAVTWPIPREQMLLSDRDKSASTLRQLFPDKFI